MKTIDVPCRLECSQESTVPHSKALFHTGQSRISLKKSPDLQLCEFPLNLYCKFEPSLWNCHFIFILAMNSIWTLFFFCANITLSTTVREKLCNQTKMKKKQDLQICLSQCLKWDFRLSNYNYRSTFTDWTKNKTFHFCWSIWRGSLGEQVKSSSVSLPPSFIPSLSPRFTFVSWYLGCRTDRERQQMIGRMVTHLLADALLIPGCHQGEKWRPESHRPNTMIQNHSWTHPHKSTYAQKSCFLFSYSSLRETLSDGYSLLLVLYIILLNKLLF